MESISIFQQFYYTSCLFIYSDILPLCFSQHFEGPVTWQNTDKSANSLGIFCGESQKIASSRIQAQ